MSIKVYNTEKFERNKRRYIIFAVIFTGILVLSLLNKNFVGAVLLFFLLGAYFYYSVTNSQIVNMTIDKNHLSVGSKIYPWSSLTGYTIEIDRNTQLIQNIVLLSKTSHTIHTINDEKERIRDFILMLDKQIPMIGEYNQTFLEKMARKFKL